MAPEVGPDRVVVGGASRSPWRRGWRPAAVYWRQILREPPATIAARKMMITRPSGASDEQSPATEVRDGQEHRGRRDQRALAVGRDHRVQQHHDRQAIQHVLPAPLAPGCPRTAIARAIDEDRHELHAVGGRALRPSGVPGCPTPSVGGVTADDQLKGPREDLAGDAVEQVRCGTGTRRSRRDRR